MCGRYTQKENVDVLLKLLRVTQIPSFTPRYNITPNQTVACVRHAPENGHRECVMLKWGFIPSWAKDASIGHTMINARSETVAVKPSFKIAFQRRRCLVLADGFYEWKREGKTKQPYYVRVKDGRPFAFAGLWERWQQSNVVIDSCTIMTTNSNTLMETIHPRMPVMLDPKNFDTWLDPAIHDPARLSPLLSPFPSDAMTAYPVSPVVNNPQYDSIECLTPLT